MPEEYFLPETYTFTRPLSPHLSARLDGLRVEMDRFVVPHRPAAAKHLIIEGAGGVMVPLNDDSFVLDLIKRLGAPALVVARSGLGTINHSILTVDKLRSSGVEIFGVVMNGPVNRENRAAIEKHAGARVIAEIEHVEQPSPTTLRQLFESSFQTAGDPGLFRHVETAVLR